MSRARDRLVIELHIAGFRVEPRSFAKSCGAPEPDLHTYDIRCEDGVLVTRIIVLERDDRDIDTFYLSTAETVTEYVTRIIDLAARQMAAERAAVA